MIGVRSPSTEDTPAPIERAEDGMFSRDPADYRSSAHFTAARKDRNVPSDAIRQCIEAGDLYKARGGPNRWLWEARWCSVRWRVVFKDADDDDKLVVTTVYAPAYHGRGSIDWEDR